MAATRVAQPFVATKCGRTPETFAKDQFNDNISYLSTQHLLVTNTELIL
jgi:hypothetical protein